MYIIDRKAVGTRVRLARVEAYKKLGELADAIGIGHSVLSRLELRGQGISAERIEKIASVLGVTVEQLTGYSPHGDTKLLSAVKQDQPLLVDIPIFDHILRQNPASTSDKPIGLDKCPNWAVPKKTSDLYVWQVDVEHLPPGTLWGDFVIIQWQERPAPKNVVGKMVAGYHKDKPVMGRVTPGTNGYVLHDDQINGRAISCNRVEICGRVLWSWRGY